MKKKFAVVMAATMALSGVFALAGCGSDEEDYVEPGATEVVVYFQDFEEWNNNHVKKMIREFNSIKDDGIQLVPRFFQDEAYPDALAAARENKANMDIFMCSYGNLYGTVVSKNYAAPLNTLLKQEYFDDLVDSVKPMVSYDGIYYAYPQLTEPAAMLFYRKDLFTKAEVTEVPKSWADLLSVCAKVQPQLKRGQYTIGLPNNSALGWATYGLQYNAAGSLALNDEWTECLVDCQGYRDLCSFWYDLYDGGYVPAGSLTVRGYNDIIEALLGDKLAMTFAGSWSMAEIVNPPEDEDYPVSRDQIGYAALPTLSGNADEVTASNGGWTFCISSYSTHKTEAARVLEWFFCENAERTARFFEASAYSKSAVNKSVQQHLQNNVPSDLSDWLTVMNGVANRGIPEPTYAWDISLAVAGMLENCALNTGNPNNKTTLINNQISSAVTKIKRSMEIQGTNPAYKVKD